MDKIKIFGIVSGYFNPIHSGHIDYFVEARKNCDYLFAIVNNDKQVRLKGSKTFMDELERCKIISSIKYIDDVVLSRDEGSGVSDTLKFIDRVIECMTSENNWRSVRSPKTYLTLFFNSGDRNPKNQNSIEIDSCERLGIIPYFLDLPKVNSSSDLLC